MTTLKLSLELFIHHIFMTFSSKYILKNMPTQPITLIYDLARFFLINLFGKFTW